MTMSCERKCQVEIKGETFTCLGQGNLPAYLLVKGNSIFYFGPQSVYVLNVKGGVPANCPVELQREPVEILDH